MSNIRENDLENVKNDLKSSLENLKERKSTIEARMRMYECDESDSLYPHVLWRKREELEERILDRKFQIAVLDFLGRMNEPINVTIGDIDGLNWAQMPDVFHPYSGIEKANDGVQDSFKGDYWF